MSLSRDIESRAIRHCGGTIIGAMSGHGDSWVMAEFCTQREANAFVRWLKTNKYKHWLPSIAYTQVTVRFISKTIKRAMT